jgi:hypothetical protein
MREHEYDGRPVTDAQMYWRELEINGKYQGDLDSFDQEYISDPENGFLLMSRSVFRTQMRQLQKDVDHADAMAIQAWSKLDLFTKGPIAGEMEYGRTPSPFDNKSPGRPRVKFNGMKGGRLWVWQPPKERHVYSVGIDPAGGNGGDNATIFVLDVSAGEQVAEFADNHTSPEELADICVAIGYWYNYALLMPELNTFGSTVIKRIKQIWQYGNLGKEEKFDEVGLKQNKYGVFLSSWNKPVVVNNFINFIKMQYIRIASRELLGEMSTFDCDMSEGEEDYHAQKGQRDDRVFAAAHACYAVKQTPRVFASLNEKRRIPNAIELGLSHQPTRLEEDKLESDMAKDLVAAMGITDHMTTKGPSWRVSRTWR